MSAGRQPHEIGFVLLGELTLEPIRGLDEPIIGAVRSDQGDGQPASHRRVVFDLVAEVPPLVAGSELLVGQPDRPGDLVCVRVDAESLGRRSVIRPLRVFLREREVFAGVSPPLADQLRGCSLVSPSEYPSLEFACANRSSPSPLR